MLIGVILLCALFSGLDGAMGSLSLRRTYQGVAVLAAGGAVLVPLFALLSRVWEAVQQVTVFLTAYVPVYGAILLTGGRGATALSYQTTLLAAVQLLLWLVRGVVFPVLLVSLGLGCTGAVGRASASIVSVAPFIERFCGRWVCFPPFFRGCCPSSRWWRRRETISPVGW
jgi:hypothetical protein